MFYSHDLLTNRQYGVATIWLVATLGSKSNLKKVTRKAILDVDIPKACNTITSTDTPLALRLQASLLYGVARVHFQQCNYVLTDTQSFRDKMRGIAQVMKELELDPDVGRTRPEQLNLPDDPAFLPDLDFTFDLSAFDLPSDSSSSRASSVLSSRNVPSSQTSAHDLEEEEEEAGLQLEIPPLDTPSGFGGMSIGVGTSAGRGSALHSVREESHIIDEADFEIAADGSLVAVSRPQTERVPSVTGEGGLVSESGFSTRVRDEHAAGMAGDQGFQQPYDDDGMMMMMGDDDELRLPSAEPFPGGGQPDEQQIEQPAAQDSPVIQRPESTSTETAEASERRARPSKRAQMDQETGLQNRHLGDWNTNYLENMKKMSQTKQQKRAATQGKKNAAFWILGQGIGGVQANFGEDRELHPLAIFSGQALLDALTGPNEQRSPTGSKRARSPSSDDEDERRVRARTAEDEEGRGLMDDGQPAIYEDDGIMMQGDDFNLESEVGRPAGSSIPDVASILPWNRSASRHGSAQPFPSAGFGFSSSVGGPGSGMKIGPGHILGGMRSRLPSSSPLVGKGRPVLDLDDLHALAGQGTGLDDEGIMDMDDFEQYGPSAAVDTQTAAQSQWMRATLENEAQNFLGFIEAQLVEQGEGGTPAETVTLDELLPPEENSGIVAAQALLHVLALTTKGLLEVEQEGPFGDILLKVVRIGNQAHVSGGRDGQSSSPEREGVSHGSQLAEDNDDGDEEDDEL